MTTEKVDNDATLPEPVGAYEKKRLKWQRDRVARALAGLEVFIPSIWPRSYASIIPN